VLQQDVPWQVQFNRPSMHPHTPTKTPLPHVLVMLEALLSSVPTSLGREGWGQRCGAHVKHPALPPPSPFSEWLSWAVCAHETCITCKAPDECPITAHGSAESNAFRHTSIVTGLSNSKNKLSPEESWAHMRMAPVVSCGGTGLAPVCVAVILVPTCALTKTTLSSHLQCCPGGPKAQGHPGKMHTSRIM